MYYMYYVDDICFFLLFVWQYNPTISNVLVRVVYIAAVNSDLNKLILILILILAYNRIALMWIYRNV